MKTTHMKKFIASTLFLVFAIMPTSLYAATLSLDPSKGSFGSGDMFVVTVRIETATNECVNAATVDLHFPSSLVKVTAVSKGESLMTLWADEPAIDNEHGVVNWSGGIPGGYCGRVLGDPGKTNIIGKVVFTVRSTVATEGGEVSIPLSFGSSTQVLLNDGFGTVAPLTTQGSVITRALRSSGVTNEWLDIVHADTLPPDSFTVSVQHEPGTFAGKYFIVFSSIDKQSGVDHYEVMEDDPTRLGFVRGGNVHADFITVKSPYLLVDQSLKSRVVVRAIDNAGNIQEAILPPTNGALSINAINEVDTTNIYGIIAWFTLALVFVGVLLFVYWKYGKRRVSEAELLEHHDNPTNEN